MYLAEGNFTHKYGLGRVSRKGYFLNKMIRYPVVYYRS